MTHPGCIPAGFGPSAQVAHSVSGRYSFPCKGSAVRTSPQVWRYRKALAGWCGQARFVSGRIDGRIGGDMMSVIARCPATKLTMDDLAALEKADDGLESCTLARRTALRERDEAREQLRGAVEALRTIVDRANNGYQDLRPMAVLRSCGKVAEDALRAAGGQ